MSGRDIKEAILYNHILIPTDGSEVGTRAVKAGLDLARAIGAKVTILTVLQPFHMFALAPEAVVETENLHQKQNDEHVRIDNDLEQMVRASGVACTHLQSEQDHLSDAVIATAGTQGCDLIVIPAHERYGLLGRSVDSETVKLLTKSTLPVLVQH